MKLNSRSLGMTWLVVILLVISMSTACHRQMVVTNLPTGVTQQQVQNWYAAVGIFKMAAETTQSLTNAAISMHLDFPDEATYQKTLEALGNMAQIEAQAGMYLDTVPNNWNQPISTQVKNYANQLSVLAKTALTDGLAHVKNPTKVAAIKTLIDGLNLTIQTAVTLTTS